MTDERMRDLARRNDARSKIRSLAATLMNLDLAEWSATIEGDRPGGPSVPDLAGVVLALVGRIDQLQADLDQLRRDPAKPTIRPAGK